MTPCPVCAATIKQLRGDLARAVDRLKDAGTAAGRLVREIRGEQLPTARRNSRRVEANTLPKFERFEWSPAEIAAALNAEDGDFE